MQVRIFQPAHNLHRRKVTAGIASLRTDCLCRFAFALIGFSMGSPELLGVLPGSVDSKGLRAQGDRHEKTSVGGKTS